MDISSFMNYKRAWDTFKGNHPKFPSFIKAVKQKGVPEGTEIEISVRYPDGQTLRSGIKVRDSDLELLQTLGSAMQN